MRSVWVIATLRAAHSGIRPSGGPAGSCRAFHEQRAARAVADRIDHDERAADAIVLVRFERQGLLRMHPHLADVDDR